MLYGSVQETLDFSKSDHLIEFLLNFAPCHPEDGAVKVNILPPAQFSMKSCANFKQGGYSPPQADAALGGFCNPAKNFQKRALACTIPTNDSNNLTSLD